MGLTSPSSTPPPLKTALVISIRSASFMNPSTFTVDTYGRAFVGTVDGRIHVYDRSGELILTSSTTSLFDGPSLDGCTNGGVAVTRRCDGIACVPAPCPWHSAPHRMVSPLSDAVLLRSFPSMMRASSVIARMPEGSSPLRPTSIIPVVSPKPGTPT